MKPPERLTVSEWADRYRILDAKTSARPGKWRTDATPYLREVMDTFNDLDIEEVVFCCASQVGKTETLNNIMGYIVDQDPSPCLVVYPTLDLAEWVSENRLQPMFKLSPATAEHFQPEDGKRLELQFDGMYLVLSGANSPASLASRPVRFVLFDEIDKYPGASKKEADPISLGEERTKTFWNRKVYKVSTPTLEFGPIWQAYQGADVRKGYYVPCPHCGHYLKFQMSQIKWPEGERNPQVVRDIAWYECESCHGRIEGRHKPQMLRYGEWRAENEPIGRVRSVGYHLNSIYSPWLTFGEVAAKFLAAQNSLDELRNFVNSWLGEPWKDKAHTLTSDIVLRAKWTHEHGTVPDGAVFLTAGVDVQLDHFWWAVRAWGEGITSWSVDWGRVETWTELEEILVKRLYRSSTGEFLVALACLDSGYRTDEVYEFCSRFPELCKPTKGANKRLRAPYMISSIEKGPWSGLKLYMVDTHYFKDFVSGRLRRPPGTQGSWMVTADCTREYAEHITSEQKIVGQDPKTGKQFEEWRPVSTHAQNHLLDCEVNAALAAELLGVRYVQAPVEVEQEPELQPEPEPQERSGFVRRRDWFNRRG
jgi:phage terminase large subunit GpA-like protein